MESEKRKPKIFVVGASGLVGFNLAYRLKEDFFVSGATFRNHILIPGTEIFPVDMKKIEVVDNIIRMQEPDFVINALGLTDPKAVLDFPKLADTLNTVMATSLAVLCSRLKAKFIHISCALVYEGADGNFREDHTNFSLTNELAKQKFSAESFIRSQTMESTMLRLGKVVNIGQPHAPSPFDKARSMIGRKETFVARKKRIDSYISGASLAAAVKEIISNEIPNRHRILNLGGPALSEFDFYEGWARIVTGSASEIKPHLEDSPRNTSINSQQFMKAYPNWKQETQKDLYLHLLQDLNPGIGVRKSIANRVLEL